MNNYNSELKNVLLLGLLPLLAASKDIITAVIISISLFLIVLLLKILYSYTEKYLSVKTNWFLMLVTGFSLANFCYLILPNIFSELTGITRLYILLLGSTPLIYSLLPERNSRIVIKKLFLFLLLILSTSIIRELVGRDILTVLKQPAGGFLVLGLVGISLEIILTRINLLTAHKDETNQKKRGGEA
ncbi:MAG: hypothetical protein ACOC4G_02535 [Bacillota bacterium]